MMATGLVLRGVAVLVLRGPCCAGTSAALEQNASP